MTILHLIRKKVFSLIHCRWLESKFSLIYHCINVHFILFMNIITFSDWFEIMSKVRNELVL